IKLTRDYPEINVEICVDYGLTDIVAGRYDAGVRLGDQVAKDMIAVRIGPDLRMAVVGSESYLAGKSRPQSPADLAGHTCINLRLPTHGGLMAWEFERDGHLMKARVEGQWTFNSSTPILRAALSGFGLAYLPEDMVAPHVQSGALKRVMKSWTPTFPGYHLYYASRRHSSPAFRLLVEALRYPSRGKA
ncbi:LysR substrate-binding domain-containing protein, partial [Herbaspirillum huttiense]